MPTMIRVRVVEQGGRQWPDLTVVADAGARLQFRLQRQRCIIQGVANR